MSTAAVSSNLIYKDSQQYFQQRASDLQQLGQALQNGDLTAATQEFGAISNLGQNGPFANGDSFKINQRQADFNAIGQALQNGDLAGAKQALVQLRSTFQNQRTADPPSAAGGSAPVTPSVVVNLSAASTADATSTSTPATSTASGAGNEIVLNLGDVTPGEQITIGVSNGANGSEQVTIGVNNGQNQSPEQFTLNLNQNSNQQIVLNLLNNAASTAGSTAQSSSVNVTA
ncbi:MAG TPA: hypothetical protein VGM18_16520 [Candidatus Sulfotelmatobacter sp.]|jgi:hypothetical protein